MNINTLILIIVLPHFLPIVASIIAISTMKRVFLYFTYFSMVVLSTWDIRQITNQQNIKTCTEIPWQDPFKNWGKQPYCHEVMSTAGKEESVQHYLHLKKLEQARQM